MHSMYSVNGSACRGERLIERPGAHEIMPVEVGAEVIHGLLPQGNGRVGLSAAADTLIHGSGRSEGAVTDDEKSRRIAHHDERALQDVGINAMPWNEATLAPFRKFGPDVTMNEPAFRTQSISTRHPASETHGSTM